MKKILLSCGFGVLFLFAGIMYCFGEKALTPIYLLLLSEDGTPITPGDVTLSGTIEIAEGIVVDNDVNDPSGQNGPKNDPGDHDLCPTSNQVQTVPNPVTIAGYVNLAGTGPAGESQEDGDVDDYYRIDLKAGQVITLNIADPETGDLDLAIYNDSCVLVDLSEGTEKSEQIVITSDGTYYIDVYPYSGYSNYTLTVGQNTGGYAKTGLNLTDEFVVGEVIVSLKYKDALPAHVETAENAAAIHGMAAKAGAPGRQMLWRFDPGNYMQQRAAGSAEAGAKVARRNRVPAHLLGRYDTLQAIKALRKQPGIEYAEPNYIQTAALAPNDTYYSNQWHYPLIHLPEAWDITTGGTGGDDVIVAVVDTGVLLAHEDLQGQLVGGYDFISDAARALDGGGIDSNPDDPGDQGYANGNSTFHGTHVAGTVAAASNNAKGVAGVAWKAKIMPLRVLGKNGGTTYDIGQACLFAARLSNNSGTLPPRKADVINMSIQGYGSPSQADQDVFTQVRGAGVIIVACSGNKNELTASYPASYNGVVSVASVDMNKNRAPYSNYHSTVDVAAPGGDTSKDLNGDGYQDGVLSTCGNDSSGTVQMNYFFMQGTSMASPHMAGVVALMEDAARTAAVRYELTPNVLDNMLISGDITEDIGSSGKDDQFGYGLISAHKAVLKARETAAPAARLAVSPASLNFGSSQTTASLTASNSSGGGTLSYVNVSDDATWLTVSGSGLGTYPVTVDRTGLGAGTYSATITFDSNVNDVTVPVIMNVPSVSQDTDANAGFHYVLLIDPDESDPNNQVKAQFNVAAQGGVYEYVFNTKTKTGARYLIIAGTDFDNDGFICDNGEACGAYITLDQITPLENVVQNRNDLDFTTNFVVQLTQEPSTATTTYIKPWRLLYKKNEILKKPDAPDGVE